MKSGTGEVRLRVALYARISTVEKRQDPEMQLSELREYCERRGLTVQGEYVDRCSGSRESRPELDRLITAARRRYFDILLVWKIDRLGRSLRHLVVTLAELDSLGVAFVSLRDNLDLSTPSGRLMFHVISAMAQFERELTVERVRAGLRNARNKGKRLGRPSKNIDPAKVIALRGQGMSWREVGKELHVGTGTAYRAAAKAA
jgi:DNA invertase Pin-like site-specific DNA recombinase